VEPTAHYVAAKAAIAGLTRCIAEEGARHGITANRIAPERIPCPRKRNSMLSQRH
jgi:3-oxoacyl-[acyl-carrier protein] reductase